MEHKFLKEGKKSSMTPWKLQALEDLGFTWARRKGQPSWDARYAELVAYKQEHGDCNVPTKYTINPALGRWVSTQRSQYKQWRRANRQNRAATADESRRRRVGGGEDHHEGSSSTDSSSATAKTQMTQYRADKLNEIGFRWNMMSEEGIPLDRHEDVEEATDRLLPRYHHHHQGHEDDGSHHPQQFEHQHLPEPDESEDAVDPEDGQEEPEAMGDEDADESMEEDDDDEEDANDDDGDEEAYQEEDQELGGGDVDNDDVASNASAARVDEEGEELFSPSSSTSGVVGSGRLRTRSETTTTTTAAADGNGAPLCSV